MNQKDGAQESKSYYFGEGLELYSVKDNKKTSGVVKEAALKKINWTMTLNHIISELDTYDQLMFDVINDGPDDTSAERGVNRSSTKRDSPEGFKMMKDNRREIRNLFNTLGVNVKRELSGVGMNSKIRLVGRSRKSQIRRRHFNKR